MPHREQECLPTAQYMLPGCMMSIMIVAIMAMQPVLGQSTTWWIQTESARIAWPTNLAAPSENNRSWETDLQDHFRQDGFFTARLDSINWANHLVHMTLGQVHVVGEVKTFFKGDPLDISSVPNPKGAPFTAEIIDNYVSSILHLASDQGYVGAQASIQAIQPKNEGWDVEVEVILGSLFRLESIVVEGDSKTKPSFIQHVVGLEEGRLIKSQDLDRIKTALGSSGLYDFVGEPLFETTGDSSAVVVIQVRPRPAGSFDLSAGFVPPSGENSAQLIGNGHINLLNPFGDGRMFSAEVERYPNSSSGVSVAFRDPRFFVWPVSWNGTFNGYQQDSTFSTLGYGLRVGFRLQNDIEVGVQWSTATSKPLQAGNAFVNGLQRVGRSSGQFLGVETSISALDDVVYPRKGVFLSVLVESGKRNSRRERLELGDTTLVVRSQREEKMHFEVKGYIPFAGRMNVVVGTNGQLTTLKNPDLGEAVRFGGVNSLRGYDEKQFQATFASRVFTEMRWYSDRSTYGYLFYDAGFIKRAVPDNESSKIAFYPGYGFGFAFNSGMGPIRASYAVNNQEGWKDGRIHLGISFGL